MDNKPSTLSCNWEPSQPQSIRKKGDSNTTRIGRRKNSWRTSSGGLKRFKKGLSPTKLVNGCRKFSSTPTRKHSNCTLDPASAEMSKNLKVDPTVAQTRGKGVPLLEHEDFTQVWAASRVGDVEKFKKAVKKAKKKKVTYNEIDTKGQTALHIAVTLHHIALVQYLIRAGANLNIEDGKGWTPLHCAANSGHLDLLNLLLDMGAAVFEGEGSTPLHYLVRCEGIEDDIVLAETILKKLIAAGSSVNASNQYGQTPLHDSVMHSAHFSKKLLEYGADPNALTSVGEIPLHLAVKRGDRDLINLLLYYGADPTIKSPLGDSFEIAEKCHPHSTLVTQLKGILGMPDDILLQVFERLSLHDICSISMVCSRLHKLSDFDDLWKPFYDSNQKIAFVRPKSSFTYREVVSDFYRSYWTKWLDPPMFASVSPSASRSTRGRAGRERQRLLKSTGTLGQGTTTTGGVSDMLLRIMLIGDPDSGKSAFMHKFLGEDYEIFPPEGKDRACKVRNVMIHHKKIVLQLWEQTVRNRARMITHAGKSPYRAVNGVVVFCNVQSENSFENMNHWVEDVRRFSANSSGLKAEIILVATHCEEKDENRAVKRATLEEYANEEGLTLFEVSNTSGHNIHFAMRIVVEAIYAAVYQREVVAPTMMLPSRFFYY